jgi:hypothetical protein
MTQFCFPCLFLQRNRFNTKQIMVINPSWVKLINEDGTHDVALMENIGRRQADWTTLPRTQAIPMGRLPPSGLGIWVRRKDRLLYFMFLRSGKPIDRCMFSGKIRKDGRCLKTSGPTRGLPPPTAD